MSNNNAIIDVKLVKGFTCKLSRMSKRRRKIAVKNRIYNSLLKFAGARVSDQLKTDMHDSVKAILSKTIITRTVKVRLNSVYGKHGDSHE